MLCALVVGPKLDVIPALSQGDHGRELYAAQGVLRGEQPYRDYTWQYGPLMPYYYGLMQAILGVGARSLLLGMALLRVATALTVFAILRKLTTPIIAVTGCWWLLLFHREFPHTFSHAGGLMTLTLVTLLVLRYLSDARPRDLLWGIAVCFVLLLQKLNFGAIGLASLAAAAAYVELERGPGERRARLAAAAAIPLAGLSALAIYALMLAGLPEYSIRESLPFFYAESDPRVSLAEGIAELAHIYSRMLERYPHTAVGSLLVLAGLACWLPTLRRRGAFEVPTTRAILVIGLVYGASLHEFVLSGVPYRLRWTDASAALLVLLFANELQKRIGDRGSRLLLCGLGLFCAYFTVVGLVDVARLRSHSKPLDHDLLDIYADNDADNDASWREVVYETTSYLDENVASDERFFAAPYEPIYYFLTEQPTPTPSTMIMEFMNISEEQEAQILADLNRSKVRWIVLSNRAWSSNEVGVGVFGATHARRLALWIEENFEVVREIGPQNAEAHWIKGHATRIYRRRD